MAAGAWYSNAGIGDANIAVARRTIQIALHESQKNGALMGHPVIMDILSRDEMLGPMIGELGVSISLAALGQGKLAATAEGTEASPTNFSTTNSATVTPARRAYARDVGDFARSLQESLLTGEIAPTVVAMLANEGLKLWFNDWIDRICALASSATYEIGTTATALTWSALQDGVIDFKNRGVSGGPALALITEKGAKDLTSDALALSGAVQFRQNTQGMVSNMDTGAYLFSEWGVDFYLGAELDTDGGDDLGILIGPGAILSKHQRVALPMEAETLVDAGWYTMEARRPGGGVTRVETVSYNAVGILEAGRFAAIRHVS